MNSEIHMFSAVALAETAPGRQAGDRHPLLLFVRQAEGSAHDLAAAAAVAAAQGWTEVDITRAGTLPPDAGATMEGAVRAAYLAAVEHGAGMLAFDAAVRPAPRK